MGTEVTPDLAQSSTRDALALRTKGGAELEHRVQPRGDVPAELPDCSPHPTWLRLTQQEEALSKPMECWGLCTPVPGPAAIPLPGRKPEVLNTVFSCWASAGCPD